MQTTYYLHDLAETELVIHFDAWYQPAKLTGPWEDCYPEDSELDIYEIRTREDNADVAIIDEEEQERIEQACWDAYTEEARKYAH